MPCQPDNSAAVAGARQAMDGFITAFNAEDGEAIRARWFHFPHVRFHEGTVTIMKRPEDLRVTVWERKGEAEGWARTEFDYIEVVDAGPEKVHFRVQFTRFQTDGSTLGSYKSFYIVTLNDGRWGIQGRSSWASAG